MQKEKKWFKPLFEFGDSPLPKKVKRDTSKHQKQIVNEESLPPNGCLPNINDKNWMKNFNPVNVEDLAVHIKKVQEVDEWLNTACVNSNNDMLLLSGPVGCGKTATIRTLAAKHNVKITEWITPLDIEYPTEFGDYEFKVPQSKKFNGVSATGLKAALKRASDIISKKYTSTYNIPTADIIESVVNTSGGDVRSAILNLHFASLKGSSSNLETSIVKEKEVRNKPTRKKKSTSNKFMSLGKDQTVSILHGVGRVLNPKELINSAGQKTLTHSPKDIIEQFITHPTSFINFLEENYLPHFSCAYDVDKAASALSDGDYMLAEWREKLCQEYGLYIAVAGLMLSNKSPVSAWNPVRGPKNMKVQYPSLHELPLLEPNYLYKGKVLVTDYITYCKIIENPT
ncbi:jg16621 [Pararge aegeria aegeria]|uniref:Jg16621 protein n=1 Tax=Pararge aegeria aegeria TaxID=348720 RepID=A0A8S4RD89_9NEOP|nr:jg16621 [Pararge aegeria aegeria]